MSRLRRADAQSKETSFAGLPKIITIAWMGGAVSVPTAAGWQPGTFDTIFRNYGPYTVLRLAAGDTRVVVAEPGIYHFVGSVQWLAASGGDLGQLAVVNGIVTGVDRPFYIDYLASAQNPNYPFSGYLELQALDQVGMSMESTPSNNFYTGGTYFSLKKEGGQY